MSEQDQLPDGAERGLAAERTELAWRRTLLSFAAVGLVTLQVLPAVHGTRALALAAVVALVLTPPAWWSMVQDVRRAHAPPHEGVGEPRGRRVVAVCAGTFLLGLGGAVLILVF